MRGTVGLGLPKLTDVAGLARRPSRPEPAPRPTSPTRRLLLFQREVREVESVVWLHIRCSSCPPPMGGGRIALQPPPPLQLPQQEAHEVESVVWLHIRCCSYPPYGW